MLFEQPPYVVCPNCGRLAFGVLIQSLSEAHYERRCGLCGHPRETGRRAIYRLPQLKKHIVYLDQCVYSNFMKALNPRAGKIEKVNPKWRELFSKMDILVKMQAIACPDSNVHREESLVFEFGEDVKRVYELFSHGLTFKESNWIWGKQLIELFKLFLEGRPATDAVFEIADVIDGKVNTWQEKILITTKLPTNPQWVEMFKSQKERNHASLTALFEKWKTAKGKKFPHWFSIELDDGNSIARTRFMNELIQLASHDVEAEKDAKKIVEEFFASEYPSLAPNLRIDCALFAILAHKASHGMKELKDEGVMNDFKTLSITLPYCDAVVVDRQTAGLLREIPAGILSYSAKVFSTSELNKFGEYLNDIERAITPEQRSAVSEVYGADWPTPFLDVFTIDET